MRLNCGGLKCCAKKMFYSEGVSQLFSSCNIFICHFSPGINICHYVQQFSNRGISRKELGHFLLAVINYCGRQWEAIESFNWRTDI